MIGNKLEQSIIAVFQENPEETFTINALAKKLKKSYPIIHKKSTYFIDEGVLKKIVIGKSHICFLNYAHEKTSLFMTINELNRQELFLRKNPLLKTLTQLSSHVVYSSSIVLVIDKKIIVIHSDIPRALAAQSDLHIPREYTVEFPTPELFTSELLANASQYTTRAIIHNAQGFTALMTSIGEKLIAQHLLK